MAAFNIASAMEFVNEAFTPLLALGVTPPKYRLHVSDR